MALFMPVMLMVAIADPEFVYEGGVESLVIVIAWPIQIGCEALVGYLLAWIIPNSYPRQYSILRGIGRFLRRPGRTMQQFWKQRVEAPEGLPSREAVGKDCPTASHRLHPSC